MDLGSVRDIAVVVLAAALLMTTLVMIVTGLLVWRLLAAIRSDISPIFGSLRDTADTVRATTDALGQAFQESARSTPRSMQLARRLTRLLRRG